MFSTDPKLVKAFEKQFQEHLALCRPSLNVLRTPNESIPRFLEFFSRQGDTIQEVNSLSINSMPRELLERCVREAENPGWAKTFQVYLDDIPRFEERLSQDPYIDMCRLATAEEVRSGNVPVAAPARTYAGQLCYTPETYCLHLRNILRLMERYENYSFLPLHEKELPDYNLFANEGGMALVVRTSEPIIIGYPPPGHGHRVPGASAPQGRRHGVRRYLPGKDPYAAESADPGAGRLTVIPRQGG